MSDESRRVSELQALDAVAGEQGAVLAFRTCEDPEQVEPVFLRIEPVDPDAGGEAAMIEITDRNGLSLGRYAVPRARLEAALERSVTASGDLAQIPSDWQG